MLAPPPRRVPWSLRVINIFNVGTQVGWAVVGFTSIFFWAFVANADLSFLNFRGPFSHADGRVLGIERTNASENHAHIYENRYEFSAAGEWFRGVSYSTGKPDLSVGDTVRIEYKEDDPRQSRIAGLRRGLFGPGVLFVLLFPLVGAAFVAGAMLYGMKRNRLLRTGLVTAGVLKKQRPTNTTIQNRRVYELTFAFTDWMGRPQQAVVRSSRPEKLMDEREEPMLYDVDDPSSACMLDDAPSRPAVDENGELQGRLGAAVAAVILPVLVVGGNVLYALHVSS